MLKPKLMELKQFHHEMQSGIPDTLPAYDAKKFWAERVQPAPIRPLHLTNEEKKLALKNALRYFPASHHSVLLPEFQYELETLGRIYMYRFKPRYAMHVRPLRDYPAKSQQAACIMLMITNNLDPKVAQHPNELITYGGNGSVFQNWAQYCLTMQYLSELSDEETLVMSSGHPLGVFPSHVEAPRVVVTNGMMIPNYSSREEWNRLSALGVTMYGQMTAGSYMYIGPQGIVHGTTITLLNAARRKNKNQKDLAGMIFVSSGLGGMSGAQPKAAKIAKGIGVIAEVNGAVIEKRLTQGWVDEVFSDLKLLVARMESARAAREAVSLAYHGNIVDLWEYFAAEKISVDLGSDQTSLHQPFTGGYYPVGMSFEEAQKCLAQDPQKFAQAVKLSLLRQIAAIKKMHDQGMYFFDYGNAFLLEVSRTGEKINFPSYVQDIMGPLCFDYGYGPFRWVCMSGDAKDLKKTDQIAEAVLKNLSKDIPAESRLQLEDNLHWIQNAESYQLVVGSQARILYADALGRVTIANAFNEAIARGEISAPIVLGRDHHDVSGTDSPYRETSNVYDGSQWTADMAVQNFVGDAFRGATWVSLHNGGGVGWGEAINGGFGLVLDGTSQAEARLKNMLTWDVWNGLARRSWARNSGARSTIEHILKKNPRLKITLPYEVSPALLKDLSL